MKNSAKWELRVGLLLGLAFIMAFGMILSELRDPVTQSEYEDQTAVNNGYYKSNQPSLDRTVDSPGNADIDPVAVEPRQQTPIVATGVRVNMNFEPAAISSRENPAPTAAEPPRPVHQQPKSKPYRVVDGDTLYQIAEKAYGTGKGHKWRKIYEANRNKLSNPSAIKLGQVLIIPSLDQPGILPASNVSQQEALDHMQRYVSGSSTVVLNPSGNHNRNQNQRTSIPKIHVVRSGDNLTKIARKYFNDTSNTSINKIFKANRDQLSNLNDVSIGMKLRIPKN